MSAQATVGYNTVFLAPNWPEFRMDIKTLVGLLGTAFLGLFGFVCIQVFDMNATLQVNTDRLDRIAGVLPEMGRYIAYEEINKPVSGALVVYSPYLENSAWVTRVELLDTANGRHYTYSLSASSGQDSTHAMVIAGRVRTLDRTLPSFGDMQNWHADLEQAWEVTPTIDYHGSFVLRGTHNSDYVSFLNEYAGAPVTHNIDSSVDSWSELVHTFEN